MLVIPMSESIINYDSPRVEDLRTYMSIFDSPKNIIFGQGFNAQTWSGEFISMLESVEATRTEFTYLEILRVYGTPLSFLIIGFLMLTSINIYKRNQTLGIVLILLLVNAAFNPYLFSTNGILPLALLVSAKKYGTS